MTEPKKRYVADEEAMFFMQLGYQLFATALRGHVMGLRRPLSAARDYLRANSLPEGLERDAAQFLVDVAHVGNVGGMTLQELFEKWSSVVEWQPSTEPPLRSEPK